MKKIIYTLLACFSLLVIMQDEGMAQRKNKKMPESEMNRPLMKQPSAYDRLFMGKKVNTDKGLMTIHATNDHGRDVVYLEFPVSLLGKDMMLTSAIKQISDAGEGVIGQFNNYLYLRFTRLDSNLMIRIVSGSEPINLGNEENVTKSLEQNANPGVWQMMSILAYTPDSSAMVVDVTKLFMEHTEYTSPFAAFGGNSMGGFSQRQHRPRPEKNRLLDVKAYDNNVVVTGEYCYFVDHTFMGMQTYRKDVPVTVTADRILLLLPEEPMRPRLADTRIGITMLRKMGLSDVQKGFNSISYTTRWRLEPSDEAAYRAGKLVEPKKPIVFYMDTLMPVDWKKGIRDGFEAWNVAFEQAGFKQVVRVVEFPKNDPKFNATDINHCVIRYSPMWLEFAQVSTHLDIRSGEIINASVMVHGGMYNSLSNQYKSSVMASDPRARTNGVLPEDIRYELIKAYMTRVAGSCLGLSENPKCNGAFPVDSLRSPSFTQKYGVAPSIMGYPVYNYVAQKEDVAKGVRLIPTGPGEYDRYAIRWLYTPIYEAATSEDEVQTLNQWIAREKDNRNCVFGYQDRLMFDPNIAPALLGDDHLKSMKYYLKNLKYACENLNQWYAEGDKDYSFRSLYAFFLNDGLDLKVRTLVSHIGGMYVNYGENGVTFDFEPRSQEKKYIDLFFDLIKQAPDLQVKGLGNKVELTHDPLKMFVWRTVFSQMFSKVEYMYFTAEKSKDTYTAEEFMNELNKRIWAPALEGRKLAPVEKDMQTAMVGTMLLSSGLQTLPNRQGPPREAPQGGQKLTERMVREYASRHVSGFTGVFTSAFIEKLENGIFIPPVSDLRVSRDVVQPIYYGMLLRTKDLIKNAIPNSTGDTRQHYEYLLYKIEEILKSK